MAPQISKAKESLSLKKVNWPYEECFQLRNWLQIVKSKQWNRYEFQEPFKNLLLPALTKVGGTGALGSGGFPGLPRQENELLGLSLLSTLWVECGV